MKSATAVINTAALTHNIEVIRQFTGDSQIWVMVKANAYGHGMTEIVHHLPHNITGLGVARIDEALKLRAHSVVKPILLLEGYFSLDELVVVARSGFQTVIHSMQQITLLEQFEGQYRAEGLPPIQVWLKIDTGMHRLGFRPEEVQTAIERISRCRSVANPLHFMSHFSCADERDNDYTQQQLDIFSQLTRDCLGIRSIAASSGCFNWPASIYDAVRPGISVYGISPMNEISGRELGLRPVMTMISSLIAVRDGKKGESIGYGATWTLQSDTKLGVVAMGYGDGYPRCAPSGTPVLVNGRRVPLLGRVSMDMFIVDLGINSLDCVGDEVILWGEDLPVEEVSRAIGTIGYELVTNLTSRVKYIYSERKNRE